MRRFLISVIMILFLAAAGLGGNYCLNYLAGAENTDRQKPASGSSICEPDISWLEEKEIGAFVSGLPVLMLDTGSSQITKENPVWARMGVFDRGGVNDIQGNPDEILNCTVKLRGASSYSKFDKSQFRIKFYEKKNGKSLNYPLCGMGANSEWVLNGPFLDKTLIRNSLVYDTARKCMEWAPDSRFVEVFIDGKYQGVYLAVEPVTNGESRLRLSTFGLVSGQTSFILKRDRVGTEDTVIQTWGTVNGKTINELSISYPTEKNITDRQAAWITDEVSAFEKRLYSEEFERGAFPYEDCIDVDNFADYFILNQAVLNHDAGVLSTYVYQELGGKMMMAVWDYNNAFDNYQWFAMEYDEFYMMEAPWFDRLLRDRAFVDRICQRYRELRQDILSLDTLYGMIDGKRELLGDAVKRNYKVWGYVFQSSLLVGQDQDGEERDIESYEDAVAKLKESIKRRLEFLDGHMEELYDNCF